jgi:hypothetical protein
MDFKDKKVIAFAVLGLVLVGVIFWFLSFGSKPAPGVIPPSGKSGAAPGAPKTVLPVPKDIVVPDMNSTSTTVGKPASVKDAGGPSGIDLRNFNISVNGDKVSPDIVAVYQNDIVTMVFSAVDKDYTFVQPDSGLSWTVPKGGSKAVPFQGTNIGKFVYYSPPLGGPAQGPVGFFVVVAR